MLGNPPYVKLQNLMKVDPDVVAYLTAGRGDDTYRARRPAISISICRSSEKGLRLLAPGGRMAYRAKPMGSESSTAKDCASLVRRGRHLDRWLDFKAHQVFEDVITYTALQFYTREPRDAVRIAAAPAGRWPTSTGPIPELAVPYDAFPGERRMAGWPPARSGR